MTTEEGIKSELYTVQCGTFKNRDSAIKFSKEIKDKGFNNSILCIDGLYKVQSGAFRDKEYADKLSKSLKDVGINNYITLK